MVVLHVLYLFALLDVVFSTGCIGENGAPVNMYIIYKLPKLKHSASELVRNGSGYAYYDSDMLNAGKTSFRLSPHSIGSGESAVGRTVSPVYDHYFDVALDSCKPHDSTAHIFYNDEDSEGKSFMSNGHTKGAIEFDEKSGFWLIHSVPRAYPPAVSIYGYSYPDSGRTYGQMFICVTFNTSVFNDIGLQLRYNNPHIHDFDLDNLEEDLPNIKMLVQGEMMKDEPHYNVVKLKSSDSTEFISFAKFTTYHKDLYSSLVSPTLQANLLTETWQHVQRYNINATCDTKYTVEDISHIQLDCADDDDDGEFAFSNSEDHSKFALGKEEPFVCVGDINRQTTQYKRGGGTLCLKNKLVHSVFRNLVQEMHKCDKKSHVEL